MAQSASALIVQDLAMRHVRARWAVATLRETGLRLLESGTITVSDLASQDKLIDEFLALSSAVRRMNMVDWPGVDDARQAFQSLRDGYCSGYEAGELSMLDIAQLELGIAWFEALAISTYNTVSVLHDGCEDRTREVLWAMLRSSFGELAASQVGVV